MEVGESGEREEDGVGGEGGGRGGDGGYGGWAEEGTDVGEDEGEKLRVNRLELSGFSERVNKDWRGTVTHVWSLPRYDVFDRFSHLAKNQR